MFLDILTFEKSYDNPQKDPKMFSPPALDSDSLEDRRFFNIGMTICLSLRTYYCPI